MDARERIRQSALVEKSRIERARLFDESLLIDDDPPPEHPGDVGPAHVVAMYSKLAQRKPPDSALLNRMALRLQRNMRLKVARIRFARTLKARVAQRVRSRAIASLAITDLFQIWIIARKHYFTVSDFARTPLQLVAAVKLQAVGRGHVVRARLRRFKEEKGRAERARLDLIASRIQSAFRGHRGRLRAKQRREVILFKKRRAQAAKRLSAVYIGHLSRKAYRARKAERERERARLKAIEAKRRAAAAAFISRVYRGHGGRRKARERRRALEYARMSYEKRRRAAATKVQSVTRGHFARNFQKIVARRAREVLAATNIQRVARGHAGRVKSRYFYLLSQMSTESRASLVLQRVYRGHLSRLNAVKRISYLRYVRKAVCIQCAVRAFNSRRAHRRLIHAQFEARVATHLQSVLRGHFARKLTQRKRRAAAERQAVTSLANSWRTRRARHLFRGLRSARYEKRRKWSVAVLQGAFRHLVAKKRMGYLWRVNRAMARVEAIRKAQEDLKAIATEGHWHDYQVSSSL